MTPSAIILACAADAKVKLYKVMGTSRRPCHVGTRHLAIALIRELIEPTMPHREIASLFATKDEGTSAHAVARGQQHPRYPALLEMFRGAVK